MRKTRIIADIVKDDQGELGMIARRVLNEEAEKFEV